METGNSKAESMLPNPTPVIGNPLLNINGGIIVPNSAMGIPQVFNRLISIARLLMKLSGTKWMPK